MASLVASSPIKPSLGLVGDATLHRFAPSLTNQQALAVDNLLSADSWEVTKRLLHPVKKAMPSATGGRQPKSKRRKKAGAKTKKAVVATSYSASSNPPSQAGQDTEAVILSTSSRSATRAASSLALHAPSPDPFDEIGNLWDLPSSAPAQPRRAPTPSSLAGGKIDPTPSISRRRRKGRHRRQRL